MNTEGNCNFNCIKTEQCTPSYQSIRDNMLCTDDDFIEQLNDLSFSIKDFMKKTKKTIENIKANLSVLSDNALLSRTILSEIDKENNVNGYHSQKIVDLFSKLNFFPELSLFLRQNIKGIEITTEDFFLKAKIIFKRLKSKQHQKKEQMKKLNLQTESAYQSHQRLNTFCNNDYPFVTFDTNTNKGIQYALEPNMKQKRNKSSGLNYNISTRGTIASFEFKDSEYENNNNIKDFAERVYDFLIEMNQLQKSIISKSGDVLNKKRRFELNKLHLMKRVEELLEKKIRNNKHEEYSRSAKYIQPVINTENNGSNLLKSKTQREDKEMTNFLSGWQKMNEENSLLKNELNALKNSKYPYDKLCQQMNNQNEERSDCTEIIVNKDKFIKILQENQINSEEKIKEFRTEIESLTSKLNDMKDKQKPVFYFKEKQLNLEESEAIKKLEEEIRRKNEIIMNKERILKDSMIQLENKEIELKLIQNQLKQQQQQDTIKLEKEKDDYKKFQTIKDELQNKTEEIICLNELIKEKTNELNEEKKKSELITKQHENLIEELNKQKEIVSKQQSTINELEVNNETQIQNQTEHHKTISQLKTDILSQRDQLSQLISANEYLSRALEEIKTDSKQQELNELAALGNKIKSIEDENKKLKREINANKDNNKDKVNYSIIQNNLNEKEEKDNNSFEEELNKVFDKEIATLALPHSQIHINQKDLSNPSLFKTQNITAGITPINDEKQKYIDIIKENKMMFNVQQDQLKYFQQLEKENQGKFFQLKELFNQLIKELKIPKTNKNEFFLILKFIGYSNEDIRAMLKKKGLF